MIAYVRMRVAADPGLLAASLLAELVANKHYDVYDADLALWVEEKQDDR